MARPKTVGPTGRELALQVLWERGVGTARDLYDVLDEKDKTAYNSVLTILVIMLEKGYVKRDESEKSHIYEAEYSKATWKRGWLGRLWTVCLGNAARGLSRDLEFAHDSGQRLWVSFSRGFDEGASFVKVRMTAV